MSKRSQASEVFKSSKSTEPLNKKMCSQEDRETTNFRPTDFTQKIHQMKVAKLKIGKDSTSFSNVDELKSWLAEQPSNRKVKPFNFQGYIIGTIFDTSVNQKWSRI